MIPPNVPEESVRIRVLWSDDQIGGLRLKTGMRHKIVLQRPVLHRLALGSLRFSPGAVLPFGEETSHASLESALVALARWLEIAQGLPQLKLVIVGHASPDGPAQVNADVSLARALILRALVDQTEVEWEVCAKDHLSRCDQAAFFAWAATREGSLLRFREWNNPTDAELARACRTFQENFNLQHAPAIAVDGVCGPETRGAIFRVIAEVFRSILEHAAVSPRPDAWLADAPTVGAGSKYVDVAEYHVPLASVSQGRTVDLILIDPAELGTCRSVPLDRIYGSRLVKRIEHAVGKPAPWDLVVPLERDLFDDPTQSDIVELHRLDENEPIILSPDEIESSATDPRLVLVHFRGLRMGSYAVYLAVGEAPYCVMAGISIGPGGPRRGGKALPANYEGPLLDPDYAPSADSPDSEPLPHC
jgi:hypothetical protein